MDLYQSLYDFFAETRNHSTPQPLYKKVRYNTVLDITRISVGPQLVILDLFSNITLHFTLVITVWIANTEIGLDPNNSYKEVVVYVIFGFHC